MSKRATMMKKKKTVCVETCRKSHYEENTFIPSCQHFLVLFFKVRTESKAILIIWKFSKVACFSTKWKRMLSSSKQASKGLHHQSLPAKRGKKSARSFYLSSLPLKPHQTHLPLWSRSVVAKRERGKFLFRGAFFSFRFS